MTPEQQRIAIAEACGAKWVKYCANNYRVLTFDHGAQRWPADGSEEVYNDGLYQVPDYLNDLNAMHDAEKTLGNCEIKWHKYAGILIRLIEPHRHTINATAPQRAEAFLRTLGLWT